MRITTKIKTVSLAVSLALAGLLVGCNQNDSEPLVKDDAYYRGQAEALVARLTLSEKLDLLSGPGYGSADGAINVKQDVAGVAGYINGVLRSADGIDIPALKLADGPAGLRISSERDGDSATYYATAWPIGSLLASSWDVNLVKSVGAAMGDEVRQYGVDILLAPGMNIQRNPLNGRNFEYYSEDPLLTGKIGAAMVNGVESNGVGTTIKHYFGNNSETSRNQINDIGEPRTFREIYLRGFQIAVDEAQPWAVMTSYNKVNGTYVNERKDAVTDVLRSEWKFDGLVMSDWFAGDVANNAYKQVLAGQDLIEPGNVKEQLQQSIEQGDLDEAKVSEAAVHILTQMMKSPSYNQLAVSNSPDLAAHATLARQAGAESMVLLRNQAAALPIATTSKVASFGINQINTYKGGTGSGDVNAASTTTIAQGLAARFPVSEALQAYYSDFYENNKVYHEGQFGAKGYYTCAEADVGTELASLITAAASEQDVAVISIGRQAGEGADRSSGKGDYLLGDDELALIDAVSSAFHAQSKKVVVVLNVNGVIDTAQWRDKVDAVLLAYMAGQETGNAVADVLSGTVNPSGKLAQSFPQSYASVPSATTFPGEDTDGDGALDDLYYNEGIYVGYRYYSTFDQAVSYPFGFGLSYTSFGYTSPAIASNTLASGAAGSLVLTATITNTGAVAGKEAAQVYVSAPEVKLKKPLTELKAFAKTGQLAPGASEQLSFTIPASILASFDEASNQWIVEPGSYSAYISPSSDVSTTTPVSFTVSKEIVVSSTTPGALALPSGVDAATVTTVIK
ncbi:beta-glucosidase [Aeromonas taiwanensis]|uniref:Beta-glucosidase n=1 Tax=Aeromonas taiwanensis TaxID=633417 RepID=A0A5F0KB92_9GAMM|nr:glycoside hydrolase family 3 C-terminal domain-containing protein [Aeromonas taiwanensis]TFF76318.1 beta-glucosidase [Aeromonas taiwanensis]TFF77331.1 beta-glucosidase [Aeromonas taiwanensis]TFF80756.1 beta-glucosidase [Aeromonas taiwanensis]